METVNFLYDIIVSILLFRRGIHLKDDNAVKIFIYVLMYSF